MNIDDWNGEGKLPILYSRTATGAINFWQCWAEGHEVVTNWGQVGGAVQEARVKCEPKNGGRANATTPEQQAIKEAKSQWKKKVKKKYSPSIETAGETVRIKPILALDYSKRQGRVEYPALVQPKLNGVRCLAYRSENAGGRVVLQSRGGDFYDVEHIRSEIEKVLEPGIILDGELYLHGVSLQTITSLVRRPQEESADLWYCLFDMTDEDHSMGGFATRLSKLNVFFTLNRQFLSKVIQVPTHVASNEHVMRDTCAQYEQSGYEGCIVRTYTGEYREDYRGPDILKVKNWEDAEFRVVGWYAGKGKAENAAVFVCVTTDGKEFAVMPTGTAKERYQMLQEAPSHVGKLLTVKYLGFTDEGAPQCARAVAIRDASDL